MVLELKKNISKTYSRSSIRSENALKYSNSPHIIVETGTEESDYFISVKDNGIGIEKKYIKDIFKKFYRVPTGNVHDVKGFGLGLNFVKRIVDGHDGRI